MIPGVKVSMGGQEWTLPPLTLGQLRRLMPKVRVLTEIGAQMDEAQIETLIEVVTAAMQRNYPDMIAEQVENLLDLGNAGLVMTAVLTGSGLKAGPVGEAVAVAGVDPKMGPIGGPSMDSSPPLAAMPIQ